MGWSEKRLTEDGTWFGADRLRAINLQGFASLPLDLYLEEVAYWTYVHSMAASPNPTQLDIDTIHRDDIMPQRLQDQGVQVWRPDPEVSRQFLRDLVTRELARLRREEEELRMKQEEPSKAAAIDLALARLTKDEVLLMASFGATNARCSRPPSAPRKDARTSFPTNTNSFIN